MFSSRHIVSSNRVPLLVQLTLVLLLCSACAVPTPSTPSQSPETASTTPSSPPSFNVTPRDTDGTFRISWGVVPGVSYTLQQRQDSGLWENVYVGSDNSTEIRGLANSTYQYQIQACSGYSCSGFSGAKTVAVQRPPTLPPGLTMPARDTDGAYTIHWKPIEGATYTLQQQQGNGAWTTVYNGGESSVLFTGRANGSYQYRVRACISWSCSCFTGPRALRVQRPL